MFNLSNENDYKLLSKTKNYYNFFVLTILLLFVAILTRLIFLSFDNTNSSTSILRETSLSALPTIYDINKNRLAYSDYNYSVKNNLDEINLHVFENTFKVNNFINTFTFYEENNLIGDKSYYENEFAYKLNENNSFSFKTRNNKKDNLTEFYDLIYQYKTDCLTASLRYNKEYYSNSTKKPNEELFFNITLIPLGSTQTGSLFDLKKNK